MASQLLVFDVKEKETNSPQAPSFPQPNSSTTGFPEHKKRTRISAFKQQRQDRASNDKEREKKPHAPFSSSDQQHGAPFLAAATATAAAPAQAQVAQNPPAMTEKQRIDRENSQRLASMSTAEIEEARQELFGDLDPKVLEMLLKRANLEERTGPSPFDQDGGSAKPPPAIQFQDTTESKASKSSSGYKKVHFEDAADEDAQSSSAAAPQRQPETPASRTEPPLDAGDQEAPTIPHDHDHDQDDLLAAKPHWPQAPAPPDLDPADPDFLDALHKKYFPSLAADPSKLAWMAPLPTPNSPADQDSPYHPAQASIPVSQLRFDFRGALLPPRIARAVPVNRGLHHHGEAPEAAGYTVRELGRLARSAVPGQRCIAFQTLGRILYRLGRGNFGRRGDAVADGVWSAVVEDKIMESLWEEAGPTDEDSAAAAGDASQKDGDEVTPLGGRGHRSAHAFAVEAIWLFEKGGWGQAVKKESYV
ncbi:hypothetical protein JX266_013367 [Neoarthrinium moseri]|nr:hypothetical protein JX266_013367 [Neoarthrinium moseri]